MPLSGTTCPRIFMQKHAVCWLGPASSACLLDRTCSLLAEQHVQCDMHKDRNFKRIDVSGTTVPPYTVI